MSRSLQLKEEGNRHFQKGDYTGAESLYSQAILIDPKNPTLYTNRAMARLKLSQYDSVISDCQTALSLPLSTSTAATAPTSTMKAHYYLSQAQLSIGDHESALSSAQHAHAICAAHNDKSLVAVTNAVLRAKKARWDHAEKLRVREEADLERDVLRLLRRECEADVAAAAAVAEQEGDMEVQMVREEASRKEDRVRRVFERARRKAEERREVPDWAVDDISFGIMVDPVITKTGKSYERSSLMEHLKRHSSDPLTREPLVPSELRPNLGLRQACEEFLEENGWAVDW